MSTTIIKPELFHPESSQDKPSADSRPWHHPLQLKIKDWFQNKLLRKRGACPTLLLELPERTIRFHSLAEFSFTLASRTDYPVARMRALMKHTPEELEQTAQNIHDIEREFSDVIAKSAQAPHLIGELFSEFWIK